MYSELSNDVNYDYVVSAGELVYVGPNVYLQGTGTQYIDTGISLSGALEFIIEARIDDFSTDEKVILGANYAAQANTEQYHLRTKADKCSLFIGNDQESQTQYNYDILNNTDTGFHTISLLKYSFTDWRYLYKDGNAIVYNISSSNIPNYDTPNYYLFANNYGGSLQSGSGSNVSIKDLQLFKNSVPLLHLVPVPAGIRLNAGTPTAPCMYDVISKQLYPNLGAGNFILASTSGVAPTIKYADNGISKLYHSTVNGPVEVKKHQIMGPVGYTVVGSPTIVDGVASGFSTSSYLRMSSNPPSENLSSYKLQIKFTTSTFGTGMCLCGGSVFRGGFRINSIGELKVQWYDGSTRDETVSTLTENTSYIATMEFYDAIVVAKLINASTQSIIESKSYSTTYFNFGNYPYCIGYQDLVPSVGAFNGSIDLNQTYIKVNGKLWYWQPQETKTIIVNGVTVFNKGGNADYIIDNGQLIAANKNLYLESFGSQYIDTGIYGTDLTDYELTWQTTDTTGAYQTIIGARENSSSIDRRFSVLTGDDTNRDTALYVTSRYTKTGNWEHTYNDLVALAKRNLKKVGNSVQLNGGTTYSYSAPSTFTTPNTLKLFAMDTNGTVALYFSGKIYPCVISENNVLVRNFVPVPQGLQIGAFTVPSNGMFDIVSQTFFGNLGTGSFTVGKDE